MIARCTSAAEIMAIVDNPTVKPWLPALTMENLTEYLADPRTLAFTGNGAGAVFEWSAPSVFEGHYVFSPECRGKRAIIAATEICGIMLNDHANMLWGEVRVSNKHARWFSRQIGFRSLGVELRPDEPREVFVMERQP